MNRVSPSPIIPNIPTINRSQKNTNETIISDLEASITNYKKTKNKECICRDIQTFTRSIFEEAQKQGDKQAVHAKFHEGIWRILENDLNLSTVFDYWFQLERPSNSTQVIVDRNMAFPLRNEFFKKLIIYAREQEQMGHNGRGEALGKFTYDNPSLKTFVFELSRNANSLPKGFLDKANYEKDLDLVVLQQNVLDAMQGHVKKKCPHQLMSDLLWLCRSEREKLKEKTNKDVQLYEVSRAILIIEDFQSQNQKNQTYEWSLIILGLVIGHPSLGSRGDYTSHFGILGRENHGLSKQMMALSNTLKTNLTNALETKDRKLSDQFFLSLPHLFQLPQDILECVLINKEKLYELIHTHWGKLNNDIQIRLAPHLLSHFGLCHMRQATIAQSSDFIKQNLVENSLKIINRKIFPQIIKRQVSVHQMHQILSSLMPQDEHHLRIKAFDEKITALENSSLEASYKTEFKTSFALSCAQYNNDQDIKLSRFLTGSEFEKVLTYLSEERLQILFNNTETAVNIFQKLANNNKIMLGHDIAQAKKQIEMAKNDSRSILTWLLCCYKIKQIRLIDAQFNLESLTQGKTEEDIDSSIEAYTNASLLTNRLQSIFSNSTTLAVTLFSKGSEQILHLTELDLQTAQSGMHQCFESLPQSSKDNLIKDLSNKHVINILYQIKQCHNFSLSLMTHISSIKPTVFSLALTYSEYQSAFMQFLNSKIESEEADNVNQLLQSLSNQCMVQLSEAIGSYDKLKSIIKENHPYFYLIMIIDGMKKNENSIDIFFNGYDISLKQLESKNDNQKIELMLHCFKNLAKASFKWEARTEQYIGVYQIQELFAILDAGIMNPEFMARLSLNNIDQSDGSCSPNQLIKDAIIGAIFMHDSLNFTDMFTNMNSELQQQFNSFLMNERIVSVCQPSMSEYDKDRMTIFMQNGKF